jgi:nucleoside-diphosphate-sugar epimerase
MRILVTGAAGFIGSEVVCQLAGRGDQVIAVDRNPRLLERSTSHAPDVLRFHLDLCDAAQVVRLIRAECPDALIHLAWYAAPQDYLTSHANLASLAATATIVEAVLSAGCRKLVIGGSCAEYAVQDRLLVEDDPVDPRTLYAACKHAAWHLARILAAEAGADLAWARIFHLHGPRENAARLIPWVAEQLTSGAPVDLTDGNQVRDHLHVADVASGFIALLAPEASGIFNICSGQPVTLRQVLETVGEIVGNKQLLRFGARAHRPGETMYLAGDPSRLRSLGWAPRFGLRDGLVEALHDRFLGYRPRS